MQMPEPMRDWTDLWRARKLFEDLEAQGLLEKITDHKLSVGLCERSKTIVEPRDFDAVVLQDDAAGGTGDCGGGARRNSDCSGKSARRISSTGCGISVTGRSRGNCGGDIEFRHGIAESAAKSSVCA